VLDLIGLPIVALAVAPAVAILSGLLYATSPQRKRDAVVRGALIVAVSLTAIEVLLAALAIGFLLLVGTSRGVAD
jgi:hypothetical protein